MAKPTPTAEQITAIESTVQDQETQQSAFTETASLQDAVIDKAAKVDQAFKDLFNWYNDAIIGKYDAEKKAINGIYIPAPIVEADITNVSANPPSGRLVPTPPAANIVRIAQFDGGGTATAADYEQKHITDQASAEDTIQNGYSGGSFNPTTLTDSALTGASTTLDITDASSSVGLAPNDIVVVEGITEIAVIKILTIAAAPGTPPPYDYNATIEVIVPPSGTIAIGANFANFSGFTNSERTSKTATDAMYQGLMDYLIDQIEAEINKRLLRLAEQLTALGANEDPDGVTNIGAATTSATNNQTFLNNYLVTTDVSDTGLASLASDRGSRSSFLTTRLSQITAAYTGQTENYYNMRYDTANNRGNTQRGTLRAKSNAQSVKNDMLGLAASLTSSINSLNGILPP